MPEQTMTPFPISRIPAVNVSKVPQRSPLRYPGGKTWLIPHIHEWLRKSKPKVLIEPFAGGGIVSLTAVMENLTNQCIMIERDHDVAAFWHAALRDGATLAKKILQFNPTHDQVKQIENNYIHSVTDHGFRTLVLNRTRNSGILAPGASLIRNGENGKGIQSRWYPDTLAARIDEIQKYTDRITFCKEDAMRLLDPLLHGCGRMGAVFLDPPHTLADKISAIREYASQITFCETDAMQLLEPLLHGCGRMGAVFLDPPYTAGGKRAGTRLYAHNDIDHPRLFEILAYRNSDFLMTYDCSSKIIDLIHYYKFSAVSVQIKTAHHNHMPELIITREPLF